jgi:hypothetical protein
MYIIIPLTLIQTICTLTNGGILLFPEKEAKSVCSASQKTNSAKLTLEVCGRALNGLIHLMVSLLLDKLRVWVKTVV